MNGWSTVALSVVCAGMVGASFVNASCGTWDPAVEATEATGGDAGVNDAGVAYCGESGQACCASAGQTPRPECDNGDESQCTGTTTCPLSSCQAVNTTKTGCEAFTNNPPTGALGFRMRRIMLVAPTNLATQTAQNTVVNTGVDMTDVACGAKAAGPATGDFSWILSVDKTAGTITTGGAPPCNLTDSPSCNPFTTGYCFVNKTFGSLVVKPITAKYFSDSKGLLYANGIGTINVPIYFQGSVIVLPISGGAMSGVQISPDGNCIGTFNPDALYPDCSNDYTACSLWKTDGSITGYITLEQADTVQVKLLNATLCAFLTNTPSAGGGALAVCPRDGSGKITKKGDFCSTTNPPAPGGCQDSYWLAATFAASAVKINDGSAVDDCHAGGAPPADAGTDAGNSGPDASDAATD